jgi:hypothetical protein
MDNSMEQLIPSIGILIDIICGREISKNLLGFAHLPKF